MSALFKAPASTDSAPAALLSRTTFSSFGFFSDFRFSVAGGGVVARGGVATAGASKAFEVFVMCA